MKVASSSASFAHALTGGELTLLEWMDLCANELEVDGVVFDAAHFARSDDEYLAQLKKCAVDLGLTVAGIAADGVLARDGARFFGIAAMLGAPLVITRAAGAATDATAWGDFTEALKARAADAKRTNITLALRHAPATLCPAVADLARATKDVDSAWLRYAFDPRVLDAAGGAALRKAAIVMHEIEYIDRFASPGDTEAAGLIDGLAHFRGFVVLEAAPQPGAPRDAYHHAVERFANARATRLATPGAFVT